MEPHTPFSTPLSSNRLSRAHWSALSGVLINFVVWSKQACELTYHSRTVPQPSPNRRSTSNFPPPPRSNVSPVVVLGFLSSNQKNVENRGRFMNMKASRLKKTFHCQHNERFFNSAVPVSRVCYIIEAQLFY